jgi:hypothetical protein
VVLRTGFTTAVTGGPLNLTAAMLSACFAADLGKASWCCCALLPEAPKATTAANTVAPARCCSLGYFRVAPSIFESKSNATVGPQTKMSAAYAKVDSSSTLRYQRGRRGNRIFAQRALADGIFAHWIFAHRRGDWLRLRTWEVGSSCCSDEG